MMNQISSSQFGDSLRPEIDCCSLLQKGFVHLRETEDFNKAENCFLNAVKIAKRHQLHPVTLGVSLMGLGTTYCEKERYADAEQRLCESIDVLTEHYGSNHSKLGAVLEELATTYQLAGRYNEAHARWIQVMACSQDIEFMNRLWNAIQETAYCKEMMLGFDGFPGYNGVSRKQYEKCHSDRPVK